MSFIAKNLNFLSGANVLYKFNMYYLQDERPCCIGRYKLKPMANVVNGLKNSSSYELTGEKSLEIDKVYAEKINV